MVGGVAGFLTRMASKIRKNAIPNIASRTIAVVVVVVGVLTLTLIVLVGLLTAVSL